jgi:hypothetical protein
VCKSHRETGLAPRFLQHTECDPCAETKEYRKRLSAKRKADETRRKGRSDRWPELKWVGQERAIVAEQTRAERTGMVCASSLPLSTDRGT